jgi:hypothetical protein
MFNDPTTTTPDLGPASVVFPGPTDVRAFSGPKVGVAGGGVTATG